MFSDAFEFFRLPSAFRHIERILSGKRASGKVSENLGVDECGKVGEDHVEKLINFYLHGQNNPVENSVGRATSIVNAVNVQKLVTGDRLGGDDGGGR